MTGGAGVTENAPDGVVITNKDIYIKVMELSEKVQAGASTPARVEDHETRLRAVERWKFAVPPTMITGAIALLLQLLGGHHG